LCHFFSHTNIHLTTYQEIILLYHLLSIAIVEFYSQSSRLRDERVLDLINEFDEITRRKGLMPGDSVPDVLKGALGDSMPGAAASPGSSSTGLSRTSAATIADIAASLRASSNTELAAVAGKTVSQTGVSLVSATSW
jgi:hypothetical protein